MNDIVDTSLAPVLKPTDNGNHNYLTKLEAAELLHIAPRTLDLWLKRRLIPFYRIGRTVRLSAQDIDSFLRARCRVAAD